MITIGKRLAKSARCFPAHSFRNPAVLGRLEIKSGHWAIIEIAQ